MLYKTTFSPSAFKLGERTFTPFIGLLRELDKNCLVVTDSQGRLEASLTAAVQNLPAKYQRQAKEYYKSLKKKGRIVRDFSVDSSFMDERCCNFLLALMHSIPELSILTGDDCCLESLISPKSRLIKLEEYLLSNRFMHREDNYVFSDGQIDKDEMEARILIPLFETAKSIKIIDRYIGRSMIDRHGNIKSSVVDHYQKNLTWLLEIFNQYPSKSPRTLEIYTGLDPLDLNADDIKCLYNKLIDFSGIIKRRFTSFNLDLKIKRETTRYKEMPHARYLITNQVSVLIERGFDLLWNDDQMYSARLNPRTEKTKIRDVTIALISEPGKVEESIRTLPDLSSSFS